ncbi:MAG: hypothetical protein WC321_04065 [Candidatus Omnitrophota bacterium]|jgi:cbb3-type cytochrome oxidase subunit 3
MANQGKSPVLLLIILIVISLFFAGGIFFLYQREHARNLALSDELDNSQTKLKMTEAMLDETKKKVSGLELKLRDTQAQIERMAADLQQEKSAKLEALSQLDRMALELQQQKDLRADLEGRLTQTQTETENAKTQLKTLQSERAELQAKVAELQMRAQDLEAKMQGIELGEIVVSPEGKAPAKKEKRVKPQARQKSRKSAPSAAQEEAAAPAYFGVEGTVLVVNKDYDFAVINLGAKDGVNVGNLFSVYKNKEYIGDIKIEKVHDSMSAADFASAGIRDMISEGDKVVRRAE